MKIFLIGFMGCGKSTLGKKLATKLGYDFIDLDHQLEKELGDSVGNYFATHGEDAFRRLEKKTLQEYNYPANIVIATGGGAPCYFDNMEWMNANGKTVYIEMSPVALAKRLEGGKEKRPLIKNLNEVELIAFIEAKLAEREVFYKQAAINANGISLTADALRAILLSES
ncbi:shikimate kinase [Pedobacter frigoris]|uniref:Shikimate kinase n=1 Tax=Pedobacter frigoris TaxID=2571272 RepID=A0A4V5NYL1_9SPHI|nr:shikimate kinase [Pedobacter frigoris]TKC04410.1 shikimate kinase [Pedobacter frigoris]